MQPCRVARSTLVNVRKLFRVYESLKNPNDKERVVTDALVFLSKVKENNETVPPSHCGKQRSLK